MARSRGEVLFELRLMGRGSGLSDDEILFAYGQCHTLWGGYVWSFWGNDTPNGQALTSLPDNYIMIPDADSMKKRAFREAHSRR